MKVCEYTPERAKVLTKLNIPEFELRINTKILWLDIMASGDIGDNHASFMMHSHSFFELIFSLSGKMYYEYNGQQIEVSGNSALFIPPSTPHRFAKCSDDCIKVSIAFSLGKSGENSDFSVVLNSTILHLPKEAFTNINYILKQSDNKNFLLPSVIGGRILEILCNTFDALNISLPERNDEMIDSRVLVAKSFIKNNHHRIIKSEDVSKECCLSTKQLSRIFKKHTGVSISEYIVTSKIKYAKSLLLQSDKSIKEIGFMLGFENESSFVSFYKRHTSIAPGIFRKQSSGQEAEKMSAN